VNARFEDWEGAGSFDLAIAVTSWHWLDPERKYKRVAAALKGGGLLAIAESVPVFPEGYDPFFEQIQDAYEAIGVERLPWPAPPLESIGDSREEIERSGLFEDVRVMRLQWSEEFTADEYVAMMRTASDHRLMEVEKREWLYGEMRRLIEARPAGRVCKHNLTMLHLARRLG
jgi:SAM-dependent methyltransferase